MITYRIDYTESGAERHWIVRAYTSAEAERKFWRFKDRSTCTIVYIREVEE